MAVSKKQPEKKRQKKKSSLWIIALIAVILLILVGVVFLVLPKFRKEAAPEKPETIKVEAAEKSYGASGDTAFFKKHSNINGFRTPEQRNYLYSALLKQSISAAIARFISR